MSILTPIHLSESGWTTGLDFEPTASKTCPSRNDNRHVRQFGSCPCVTSQTSSETLHRSQENEEGGNEDEKNDYPRPVDAARAASAHRRIEPAHEYQEEERKRHQTSHANAGEHPSTQAEDVRKKDRADTRINQPAGKGVGA